jgi:hypothetical protein
VTTNPMLPITAEFHGGRFDRKLGMPVETLREIELLRDIWRAIARSIYLEGEGRKRMRRGALAYFDLYVTEFKPGSVVPAWARDPVQAQLPLFGDYNTESCERLPAAIAEISNRNSVPSNFPGHALRLLTKLGGSLTSEECVRFRNAEGTIIATLDHKTRQRIATLAKSKDFKEAFRAEAHVWSLSAKDGRPRARVESRDRSIKGDATLGETADVDAILEHLRRNAREDHRNTIFFVRGEVSRGPTGEVRGISIDDLEDVTIEVRIRERIAALNKGRSASTPKLSENRAKLIETCLISGCAAEDLDAPHIYQDEDGDVVLEWTFGRVEVVVEIFDEGPWRLHAIPAKGKSMHARAEGAPQAIAETLAKFVAGARRRGKS